MAERTKSDWAVAAAGVLSDLKYRNATDWAVSLLGGGAGLVVFSRSRGESMPADRAIELAVDVLRGYALMAPPPAKPVPPEVARIVKRIDRTFARVEERVNERFAKLEETLVEACRRADPPAKAVPDYRSTAGTMAMSATLVSLLCWLAWRFLPGNAAQAALLWCLGLLAGWLWSCSVVFLLDALRRRRRGSDL